MARQCVSHSSHTVGDRAIAQVVLEGNTDSFVLFDGARYFANGTVAPCDPARPASITELHQAFDVETVALTWPGPRPRVYIFTHTLQEWEDAKAAVRHLVAQKLFSPRSYIEGDYTGEDQGLSAQNLDATPHSAGLVALFREAAYCTQNDLYEKEAYDEEEAKRYYEQLEREQEERENDENEDEWDEEDDSWRDEWEEEDDGPWEEAREEDRDAPQAFRPPRDEEPAGGTMTEFEADGALAGVLAPLRRCVQTWFPRGLDWRQALQRYAPRIVVCQRCHLHCETGVERAERLCTFHLYACGLGTQVEAAHDYLVTLLERRVAFLQAHADSPSC